MKKVMFVAMAMLVSGSALAQQDWRPVLVSQLPEDTFTPVGFDSNDNSQVVLSGAYPSTCYKMGPIQAKVDDLTKTVTVKNQAYLYNSAWCAFMTIPYTQVVNLGILNAGHYNIVVEDDFGAKRPMATLGVMETQSLNPDDYLYAPVREAIMGSKSQDGKRTLTLRGEYTNSCMKMDQVKIIYSDEKTVEILPIAKMVGEGCSEVMVPFEYPVQIDPSKVRDGKVLFHVRALSGNAINNVVDFSILH